MLKRIVPKFVLRQCLAGLLGLLLVIGLSLGTLQAQERSNDASEWVHITSKASLVHLTGTDSLEITEKGTQAAKLMLDALENQNLDSARAAIPLYAAIIPKENFGGDYTALQWIAEYLVATPSQQQAMLSERYAESYFQFLADNNFANLKEYLKRKYKLADYSDRFTEEGHNREAFLEDFIRFNNPQREDWEKSQQMVDALKLKAGDLVADIGSGPGYYSFKFAEVVGNKGEVLAIDTVEDHLKYVGRVSQKYGIDNVKTVKTDGSTIGVAPNQLDMAFMCSLYHVIYTVDKEAAQGKFIGSIKAALKPDGKLVIADNAIVTGSQLPYQGPYIAKELIIAQLKYYGFKLVEDHAFIPQRYVLIFQKA